MYKRSKIASSLKGASIDESQTDSKGFGSFIAKRWLKIEGEERKDIITQRNRRNVDVERVQETVQRPLKNSGPIGMLHLRDPKT